jgi:acyl-CoA thioester hydrolase
MVFSESNIRVRYAETDQMGVVYYANYLVWMEVGRVDLCKLMGFSYKEMELETGVFLAVSEARCRYSYPARFDEDVVVKTWMARATTRGATFAYEMRRAADGRKFASGETHHVFVSREMRPCRVPEKYKPLFGLNRDNSAEVLDGGLQPLG